MFKNKKAFTLTELIMVIAIIGVLMAGMTVYLGGSDDKRKVIEAQGCANTILGEMSNYAFYALTSKSLRTDGDIISPQFYGIKLIDESTLQLNYFTGKNADISEFTEFKTLSPSSTCRQNDSKLKFTWTGGNNDISGVVMNKGFSPIELSENRIFYLQGTDTKYLTGDILITICIDRNCGTTKQFAKWVFDGRTQTISLNNCAYYNDDNSTCKTREGCKVYDDEDITKCLKY